MKVLLRDKVEKLGERGEIVEVADGYARNFLLPRSLAMPATAANYRQLEIEKGRIAKLAQREQVEREDTRKRLESSSSTIVAPASPEGHLYGSVGAREIAEVLNRDGFKIDAKHVNLDEPLKEIGVYVVEIELAPDAVAKTRMWIVAE